MLPGLSTLERLIAALRERVAARQYALLAAAPSPNQAAVLENLVKVEQGRRVSRLDRLRKSPTDVSGTGLVKALDRHVELRDLGAAGWDQGQNFPVFILATLFGSDMMPRIRNFKDLIFFRASDKIAYPAYRPAVRRERPQRHRLKADRKALDGPDAGGDLHQ